MAKYVKEVSHDMNQMKNSSILSAVLFKIDVQTNKHYNEGGIMRIQLFIDDTTQIDFIRQQPTKKKDEKEEKHCEVNEIKKNWNFR